MRKINLLGLALLAVFAFGAITATTAFAAPEWLWNGNPIAVGDELLVETTGVLTLISLAWRLAPEVKIDCSGIFVGVLLNAGLDLTTELLNLKFEKIELGVLELECEPLLGCEKATPEDTFVTAENLPWETALTLDEPNVGENLYLDLFSEDLEPGGGAKGSPAYEVDCLILGSLVEVLCEGQTSADITLSGAVLLGIFTAEELELEGLEGLCEEIAPGKEHHPGVALQEGEGEIKHATGGELDVSG